MGQDFGGIMFQSHCGAIKSGLLVDVLILILSGFNPTVVRLKVDGVPLPTKDPQEGFNPTVVRLKGPGLSRKTSSRALFQSHCGAIKSEDWLVRQAAAETRFNPTVVRLKGGPLGASPSPGISFNPTVVRLKAGRKTSDAWLFSVSIPLWCD